MIQMRIFYLSTMICLVLLVCSCGREQSRFATDVAELSELGAQSKSSLLQKVSQLADLIRRENDGQKRERMIDLLLSRVSTVDFAQPCPEENPQLVMSTYWEFVEHTAWILRDDVDPETLMKFLLRVRERYDTVLHMTGEWLADCYTNAVDRGLPPETSEVLDYFKPGGGTFSKLSLRAQRTVRALQSRSKEKQIFLKHAEEVLHAKKLTGARLMNAQGAIKGTREQLDEFIAGEFFTYYRAKRISSLRLEKLRELFQESTGAEFKEERRSWR